jgi:hypothetical protein
MMVENSKHQNNNLQAYMRDYSLPRKIMDISQLWDATPQGHRYWSGIRDSLPSY